MAGLVARNCLLKLKGQVNPSERQCEPLPHRRLLFLCLLNHNLKPITILFISRKRLICEGYQIFFAPLDPLRRLLE